MVHCNIGTLREHKLPLHCPYHHQTVLWSELQCTFKNQPRSSNLAFLWRSTFIPWQKKVDKMILVSKRVLFYQTSLNFCNLGFNYQCLEKGVWGFLFCLELDLFAKVKKNWFLHSGFFTFLLITRDLNKIKKIPNTLL